MEEKKKRWRPTLTAYRELEKKLIEQIEGTSRIVQESDAWREKYRALSRENGKLKKQLKAGGVVTEEEYNALAESYAGVVDKYDEMKRRYEKLESDSKSRYDLYLSQVDFHKSVADKLQKRVGELQNRGFWARLFNK